MVRFFAERGYVILDDLGIDDFDAFAERVEADLAPLHEDGKYNRIMDAWTVSDAGAPARDQPEDPRLPGGPLRAAADPLPDAELPARQPAAAHSDAYHFHSYPKHFMCGVWVAFEDTDDDNGTLSWYPARTGCPTTTFSARAARTCCTRYVDELVLSLRACRRSSPT